MNRREKDVFKSTLDNEKSLLVQIEQNYTKALADIKRKIKKLQKMPDTQSRAYQIDFQKHLEAEVNAYLKILQSDNVNTIDDYLNLCYKTGFTGSAYILQGYDVNVIAPINQDNIINATKITADGVKLSTKISGNTNLLKNQVVQEIQRGFSAAMSFADIARNISARGQADMNRSMRIARTEGNRVYNKSASDYADVAARAGVDIVKQWVSVLDGRTRESHQKLDGEWVEKNAKFSNGMRYPCDGNGPASEVVNCRCKVTYLPRWEVESNAPRLRRDNETGEIIECRNYAEFKEKYLSASNRVDKVRWDKVATSTDREQFERYKKALGKDAPKTLADFCKIKYNENNDEWKSLISLVKSKNYLQNQLQYIHDGEKLFVPNHTSFASTPKSIAGKGADTEIRVVDRLVKNYGGTVEQWSKKAAKIKSDKYIFDVHWYECNGIQYEMKLKYRKERKR